MDPVYRACRPLLRFVMARPGATLAAACVLTAAAGLLAIRLRIDTDLANLLPPDHPSVLAIERLRRTVGGETSAAVIIECPDLAASHAFARELIPRLLALRQPGGEPFVTRVDYRRDTDFLRRKGLYLATEAELEDIRLFLERRIEEARIEANPLVVDLLDEEGEGTGGVTGEELRQIRRRLLPPEYPVSEDGRTLVLKVFVGGAKTDLGFVDGVYEAMEREVAALAPVRFHRALTVELGGPLLRHRMELHAMGDDVFNSVATGIAVVLLVVAGFFFVKGRRCRAREGASRFTLAELARAPLPAVVVGLPLGMSIVWTFGVTRLHYGALNLMTSTLALVLFGLGVEMGIHVLARYAEECGTNGQSSSAMERALEASVQPIVVSTTTTVVSFGVLTVAHFRGFSQFGFISALGLSLALIATFTVLPALVLVLERRGLLGGTDRGDPAPAPPRPGRFPLARLVVAVGLALTAYGLVQAPRVRFQWDFNELEPEFPAYDRLREKVERVYPPEARNPAYVVADTAAEVPAIVEAVRAHAAADTESPTVLKVESLQERFPLAPEAQGRKLERIAAIRDLLESRWLRRESSEDLDLLRTASAVREPVPLAELPEGLRAGFTARDGRIGNIVLIYPAEGLSDGRASMRFADDVTNIRTAEGRSYRATSTSVVAADMLRLMFSESPRVVFFTAASLLVLLPLSFRRFWPSVLALTPVTVGVVWMLSAMQAWGMSLNFYNMVVLPTVLGMGDDAGVHLTHRWVEEGKGSASRVMGSTGETVALCAVTNALGFSGMLTSFHPGLRSMGWMAVIGLGATLAASLLVLPALLQVVDDVRARRRGQRVATTSR